MIFHTMGLNFTFWKLLEHSADAPKRCLVLTEKLTKGLFLQLLARSFSLRECRRKLTARCLAMKLLKIIMMRKKKKKRPNERSNTEQRTVRKIYRNKLRVAANVNFLDGLFMLRFGLLYVILYAKRNFRMEFDQCETGRTWVLGMD